MNETAYLIFGLGLVALALITAFVGLRVKSFPNRATMLGLIGLFILMAAGTATFAVRFSVQEQNDRNEHKAAPGEGAQVQPLAPATKQHA